MSAPQPCLTRRNEVRRSPSVSSVSSGSSAASSSLVSTDNDDYDQPSTSTCRGKLYINATEANRTAAKVELARERRKQARAELQVKQGWETSFTILSVPLQDRFRPWNPVHEDQEEGISPVSPEDHQPHQPSSPVIVDRPHGPFLTSPTRRSSSISIPTDAHPRSASEFRQPSLRLLSRPKGRPRSIQPISKLAQPVFANRARPISWAGKEAQALQVASDSGSVIEWDTEEVVSWARVAGYGPQVVNALHEHDINGRALLALDSVGLKSIGVTAFGVRFKLLESVRLLRDDAPPPAHPASPALRNKLRPALTQLNQSQTRPTPSFALRILPAMFSATTSAISPSVYSPTPTRPTFDPNVARSHISPRTPRPVDSSACSSIASMTVPLTHAQDLTTLGRRNMLPEEWRAERRSGPRTVASRSSVESWVQVLYPNDEE